MNINNTLKEVSAPLFPLRVAWFGLGVLYSGFLAVGFVFHFVPPVLPDVIVDLEIGHGQAGLMMSLFALPGILLSIPAGWLVDRYGERAIGSTGLAVMGAGTLILAAAPSFGLILMGRTLSGIGMVAGVVALQRLVTRLFQGRPLGLPMGVCGSALPLGIILVLNLAGPLAAARGWRHVAFQVGWVTVAIAAGFLAASWFITRGRPLGSEPGGGPQLRPPGAGRGLRAIWIAGVIWFSANGAMTAFMTFAPDHFLDLGFGVEARGVLTSIPMWGSVFLGPVTGLLADRHGGKPAFIAWGMGLMTLALVAVPGGAVAPTITGAILGVAMPLLVTPLMSLPGAVLPPAWIGRGFGILGTCANVGIFAVPPLAGWVRDATGTYLWPFLLMALLAILGVAAADILRRGRYTPGFKLRPCAGGDRE
jgi:MFS family permease